MFYLTVTDLVPEAEAHQYQQSSAIASNAGFIGIMVLTEMVSVRPLREQAEPTMSARPRVQLSIID